MTHCKWTSSIRHKVGSNRTFNNIRSSNDKWVVAFWVSCIKNVKLKGEIQNEKYSIKMVEIGLGQALGFLGCDMDREFI